MSTTTSLLLFAQTGSGVAIAKYFFFIIFAIKFIHCTEVHFASFLSGGFTTMAVINPPERKLAKRTSVHCQIHKTDLLFWAILAVRALFCNANEFLFMNNETLKLITLTIKKTVY